VSLLILVVDDEPDVEYCSQQFRRELRAERFTMQFAQSAPARCRPSAMPRPHRSFSSFPTSTCRG